VPPPPTADFFLRPDDPSVFDTIQFFANAFDPAGGSFGSYQWNFGDGSTATVTENPTNHRYAADGDYQVKLLATTLDGRTASVQRTVSVPTHDVAIAKLTVPQSAQSEQTRQISVGVTDARYPETVRVDLYKSTADGAGFEFVGFLTQTIPARGSSHPT